MRIINFWKLVGVPDRLVVMLVMAVANASMVCASTLSVLMVGVALDVSELTLGVMRLLVKVTVLVGVTCGTLVMYSEPEEKNDAMLPADKVASVAADPYVLTTSE